MSVRRIFLQVFFERTRINADADRNTVLARRADDRVDAIFPTNVAWIDAQAVNAQLGHAQGDFIVKVDIGDQRHVGQALDLAEGLSGVHVGY